jgi:hypothetical protein
MRWVGRVAHFGEKPEGKTQFGRPWFRQEVDIRMVMK